MAHGLLADRSRRLGEGWLEVRSSGTWARRGSPATPHAVSAAGRIGVDIEAHRSTPFKRELAEWADLVVTMTEEQSAEVLQEAPEAREKTFTIKELVSVLGSLPPIASTNVTREALQERVAQANRARLDGHESPFDMDVADPLGLSEVAYFATADELEHLIDDLLQMLAGGRDEALAGEG